MNVKRKMRLLTSMPNPKTHTIFRIQKRKKEHLLDPHVIGGGNIDWICGLCEHALLESMHEGQVIGIVYKCPKCKAFNQVE